MHKISTYNLPTFETSRLILKAPTLNDAPNYQKYFADYDVVKYLSSIIPWPYPENGAQEYLEKVVIPQQGNKRWSWGIFLKSNPKELIGCIDLFERKERGNRGFWLAKKFWNQGIMTEAVAPITDYAFLQLGFETLIFENAVGNIASRKIKEKTGAKFLGLINSDHVDTSEKINEQWELSRKDWLKTCRPSFIKNYKDLMENDDASYPNSSELLAIGAPVGKKLGLKKIGIHIETLPPGRRTSWPHAESEEEEFAYIIKGNAQVWLNGYLCDLVEGDFVAFPSGTGISHTFINNSDQDVLILVGGQASIATNKIHYPMHPVRNEEMKKAGRYWEDCPKQSIGPHNGLPDAQYNNGPKI